MVAPEGELVIVMTDIAKAATLWEENADTMKNATLEHNALIRRLLQEHRG